MVAAAKANRQSPLKISSPKRCGAWRFRLRTEAFRGAAALRLDAAAGEVPAMVFGEDAAVARGDGVSGGSP
jgi:hypothetical protein